MTLRMTSALFPVAAHSGGPSRGCMEAGVPEVADVTSSAPLTGRTPVLATALPPVQKAIAGDIFSVPSPFL